ncbi:MAG: hypothetical protein JSV52_02925 [Candidatus Zixiibacteriota bacterium]|nr:MAG: hypothetical protein JSV52_02925 [candidate division Zixibacteria bacterium]
MDENRFTAAGWASIVAAVVFPLAFVVEGIHEAALEYVDSGFTVGVGPGDFLFLLYAALTVYLLKEFKSLMYEQYSFKEISTIISVAIFWVIVFFGGSFVLELLLATVWPHNDIGLPLVLIIFWVTGIAIFGIIDIILGIIILRQRHRFSYSVKVFAGLSIATGVCEATLILSFLTMVLVPVSCAVLAYIFLHKVEEIEIV